MTHDPRKDIADKMAKYFADHPAHQTIKETAARLMRGELTDVKDPKDYDLTKKPLSTAIASQKENNNE